MAGIERRAEVVWKGALTGRGTVSGATGALGEHPVTWSARVESPEGSTSPEELIAAAHAACYCMGLSHELGEGGNPPERLEASVAVGFVPGEGVQYSAITVNGRVPGIDADAFREAARAAAEGCPISGALKGNVEISVQATLEG